MYLKENTKTHQHKHRGYLFIQGSNWKLKACILAIRCKLN